MSQPACRWCATPLKSAGLKSPWAARSIETVLEHVAGVAKVVTVAGFNARPILPAL